MAVRIFGVCRKLINANLMHGVRCNKNVLRKIGFSSALNGMLCVWLLIALLLLLNLTGWPA